jgi:hypothetical protein
VHGDPEPGRRRAVDGVDSRAPLRDDFQTRRRAQHLFGELVVAADDAVDVADPLQQLRRAHPLADWGNDDFDAVISE